MIEVKGNLWTYPADYRIITTNGSIKNNGEAVMGRGCAKEAAVMYPELPKLLGAYLTKIGLNISYFNEELKIITLPVKFEWNQKASKGLIEHSILTLKKVILEDMPWIANKTFVMPRPGCGNGGLNWEDIKPFCLVLPDNFHVIDFDDVVIRIPEINA